MRFLLSLILALASVFFANELLAQSVRPLPYSAQLRTDPSVGNVQGIQRYGRPLRTDPDQGEGFSYHVYPVAEPPAVAQIASAPVGYRQPSSTAASNLNADRNAAIQTLRALVPESNQAEAEAALNKLTGVEQTMAQSTGAPANDTVVVTQSLQPTSSYPTPFDWTQGIRSLPPTGGAGAYVPRPPGSGVEQYIVGPEQSYSPDQKLAFARTANTNSVNEVFQQPLIQIKMRVVEVVRTDELAANSILEYVSSAGGPASLTSGKPLNDGQQNTKGLTNFGVNNLISGMTGTGGLINLTSEHINWVASILATNFDADVITAPEMVTTNGQNVEFVAGTKVPFQLGQNVINGSSNNIQQFFYKHVGTMVSVTPTIINWGFHGEGRGEGAISAQEIPQWNILVDWMLAAELVEQQLKFGNTEYTLSDYKSDRNRILPFGLKSELLKKLNDYGRTDLESNGLVLMHPCGPDACKNWKPDDCTIDLTVVVRLSENGTTPNLAVGDDPTLGKSLMAEKNIRAVANVIQVKSGQGVVMAGLIGEREVESVAKVPFVGDLPLVGAAFRSKTTSREKTEVLIFIEAKVLDRDPGIARAESSHDFRLGKSYVDGEFLDNPLECGMYRVGFGNYLPPAHHSEQVYWNRFGRKLRNIATHADDIIK